MNSRTLNEIVAAHAGQARSDFADWLESRLEIEPRCAATRYILACQNFDRRRCAHAVRHMMVAHHAEPAFESAALLVFAGLNWINRPKAELLPVLLDTWEEFRRPEFDRQSRERQLLNAFAAPREDMSGLSPLAWRLWRLPIRSLRVQIQEAVLAPGERQYPLLLAAAGASV